MDKFDLLCLIEAISNFAYDIHYTANGRNFYSDHLFSERLADIDVKDDFIETFYLGESEDAPDSAKISAKVAEITPKPSQDTQADFKKLRKMIVKALMAIENYHGTKGEEDLLGSLAHILQRHNGLLFRELSYTPEEIKNDNDEWKRLITGDDVLGGELNNEKWITVHPNKENPDDYRRLKVEDGETSKEAVDRKYGKKKEKEPEKDDKKDKEEKKETEEKKDTESGEEDLTKLSDKDIEKMSEKELEEKVSDLFMKQLDIKKKATSEVRETEEYKKLNQEYIDAEDKYYAEPNDSPNKHELSIKMNDAYDRRRDFVYDQTDKIFEKYKNEYEAYNTLENKCRNELANKIRERNEKERKEREEKEAERKKQAAEAIKKYYEPETIAGTTKGKPMTREEADGGKVNPKYGEGNGYETNCQSCVVAYEARLRGYDVEVLPNKKGSKLQTLSHKTKEAWLDMTTGDYAEPERLHASNADHLLSDLDQKIEKDKRYVFRMVWKGRRDGHIVSMGRDNKGMYLYDPQNGVNLYGEDIVTAYLGKISLSGIHRSPWLLRVDDKAFSPEYYDYIMKKKD